MPEKLHILFYEYVEDVVERRAPHREGHLGLIKRWHDEGRIAIAALATGAAPAQVAAVSELLRRAARRRDPAAAALQGEPWLRFLDGGKRQDFSAGPGRVLLDGGYRRELDHAQLQALLPLARRRFLELMGGRRA